MKCENIKCNMEHDGSFGSGRFCSRSCSNTRVHNQKTKDKISKTLGGKGNKRLKNCLYCGSVMYNKQTKYCSRKCSNDYQYIEYIFR